MTKLTVILLSPVILFTTTFGSALITYQYGSDSQTAGSYLLYEPDGTTPIPISSSAYYSFLGYFSDTPSSFTPSSDTFENFIVVGSATSESWSGDGFLASSVEVNTDDSTSFPSIVGAQPYFAATDSSSFDAATEFFLATFGTSTAFEGGDPDPSSAEQNFVVSSYPDLKIGTIVPDGGLGETGEGYSLTAIPEPSSYGTIAGLLGLAYAVTRRRRRSRSLTRS